MRFPPDFRSPALGRSTAEGVGSGDACASKVTSPSLPSPASAASPWRDAAALEGAIRVVVVDDHPLFRHGVVRALSRERDINIVATGETAADAIDLAGQLLPSVIVLDLNMPGGGIAAIEAITARFSHVKVLVLTVEDGNEHVTAALQAGAHGYLLKGASGRELAETLRLVHCGKLYVPPELGARLLGRVAAPAQPMSARPTPFADLTPRERQVGLLVSQGLSNREVAFRLDLTENTVKHYLTEIMRKLNLRNRVQLAVLGSQPELYRDDERGGSDGNRAKAGDRGTI